MNEKQLKEWLSDAFHEVEMHKWHLNARMERESSWSFAASDWLDKNFDQWRLKQSGNQ